MSTRATKGTTPCRMSSAARATKRSAWERSRRSKFMRKTVAGIIMLAGLAIASRTVLAHHAFGAEFDPNAPIRLQGKVVRLERVNPHTWIHIEVKDKDGKPEEWMVEGGTPNTLLRRGITNDTLA